MTLSYADALGIIKAEAQRRATSSAPTRTEHVSLSRALNRTVARSLCSPRSTPEFDTSAMDGFALHAAATATASAEKPVTFCVRGLMAAGDEPLHVPGEPDEDIYPCVEIMTGARFPDAGNTPAFDCCVRWEDTTITADPSATGRRYISVTKPARSGQNRRSAGGDFGKDDLIAPVGTVIRPHHVMALASVGQTELVVHRRPRVGVFSTGTELTQSDATKPDLHRIRDINGPYLATTLEDWGADVTFLGVLDDEAATMAQNIGQHVDNGAYDLLISTGAVSTGRFDLIPAGLQRLGANILFHKIAIRPGHPALFAGIPSSPSVDTRNDSTSRDVAFFGLPGNPVASAACLRFLVLPYLQALQSQAPDDPTTAIVRSTSAAGGLANGGLIATFPPDKDVFRPGILHRPMGTSTAHVELIEDHSPGKIKPFLGANCWIHIPRATTELRDGDLVDCYPSH